MASKPAAAARPQQRRAIQLIRVSDVNGRDKGEKNFVSPEDQRKINTRVCTQFKLKPIAELQEMNKSAYSRTLARRPGLLPAIEMIERGEAEVIVSAYFDRLFRKLEVKIEALKRLIAAKGEFITGDLGILETRTAAQRLNLTLMVAVAEFQAEQIAEKTAGSKERAIENGIAPFPRIPVGYRKDKKTRKIVKHETEAPIIEEAFKLRDGGASLIEVRDFLRAKGIDRTWRGTQTILRNRIYLGELSFGALTNLHSHEAIIDPATFRAVQNMRVKRGKRPVSPQLFARQGLVRCRNCGGRMVIGQQTRPRSDGPRVYRDYRCKSAGASDRDCSGRQSISASMLEDYVISYVKSEQTQGRWSPDEQVLEAEAALAAADAEFAETFARGRGFEHHVSVRQALDELDARCRAARERVDTLRANAASGRFATLASHWDRLDLSEQRAVLRGLIEAIWISPGTGAARIDIQFFKS